MTNPDNRDTARDRKIAHNEAKHQTIGDIRVSTWAIVAAVVIGLILAWRWLIGGR